MVLVIGGISEAKVLCERLSEKYETTLSVATEYGAELAKNGRYRVVCGKKSAEDFQRLLHSDRFDLVIDCSHPFAENVSREIETACKAINIPMLRYKRKPTEYQGEHIVRVTGFPEAIQKAKELCGDKMVFLATGSNHLADFAAQISADKLVARVLDQPASLAICKENGIPDRQVIAKCGPFSKEENLTDFSKYPIGVVVSKDSGAAGGTAEKIEAAEELNLATVLICPPVYHGICYDSLDAVYEQAQTILK